MNDARPEGGKKKQWWHSKTLWVNGLMLIGSALQEVFGMNVSEEHLLGALAVVNIVLRLVTKEAVGWTVTMER